MALTTYKRLQAGYAKKRAKAAQLRADGSTVQSIANKYGVTRQAVQRWLRIENKRK